MAIVIVSLGRRLGISHVLQELFYSDLSQIARPVVERS